MRTLLSIVAMFGLVTLVPFSADAKSKKADPQVEAEPPAAATPMNPCGCYRDDKDQCHCIKVSKAKAKCVCDGECEPPVCEQKRIEDSEKAAKAALKKIQERDKKAQKEAKAAAAKAQKEKAAADKAKKDKEGKEGSSRWK
jgi:hypothetical protein